MRLLDLLRTTLGEVVDEIVVLATIRSDRLGSCLQQHNTIKATAAHAALPFQLSPLGPMPLPKFAEIVRGPSTYEGLQVEDEASSKRSWRTRTRRTLFRCSPTRCASCTTVSPAPVN